MTIDIILTPERTFRRTEGVHFADIGIEGSNGIDLVEHSGPSISPPTEGRFKSWYVHQHQIDNNRVIQGKRLFELFFFGFEEWPHYFVMLDDKSGALEIPAGCLHRSYSGALGSILINHATRTEHYDENTEFIPVSPWYPDLFPARYVNCTAVEAKAFIDGRR